MKQKIKNLTKIILIALLFAAPASCCEIYILYEDDDYTVLLDNVTNVGVCDMYLVYDSDLVNITNVVGGDFDHFDYSYTTGKDVDDYTTLYTQAIQMSNPGLDGNIDYAKIELWINNNENGMINISVKEIREETMDGDSIPYTVRNFSVSIPPSVTVNSPNGGESWMAGTAQNIGWAATDNVGVTSIDIEYSTDGGTTYQTIATNTPNDGTYHWTVPDTTSGTCKVLVIACDAAGNTGEDVSDGDFIIFSFDDVPPTITNYTPTGTDVSVSTNITVTFSEVMDGTSVQDALSILPLVNGSFSWIANTMIFAPDSNLENSMTYTVSIGTGAVDLAGNPLENPTSWNFTTVRHTGDTQDDDDNGGGSSSGGGLYPLTLAQSPTPSTAPTAASAAATPAKQETPANAATPTPEKVTTFRTEPSSMPAPVLSPIAGIIIVVIAAIIGIVRVISITAQTSDETYAEAIASIRQAECKKAIAAIIGIVVVAIVAIIGIILIM